MLAEQPAPGVVDQRAIGLQTVADGDAVGGITRLQGERFFVKAQAGQQRLTALPDKVDFPRADGLGRDVAADKLLQPRLVHFVDRRFILGVIAVAAGEIAGGANRLHQNMKRHRRARLSGQRNLLLAQGGDIQHRLILG
ncbi:hypothetical protein SB00610_02277 [Klebsiella quasipneumoniae subsp. similipneumoniae]|nr:hypothetical protein SB00610_02277 [Klebsiella quasipneumoniae subsp. similipneumoniae]